MTKEELVQFLKDNLKIKFRMFRLYYSKINYDTGRKRDITEVPLYGIAL